jgi:hypothetical protein
MQYQKRKIHSHSVVKFHVRFATGGNQWTLAKAQSAKFWLQAGSVKNLQRPVSCTVNQVSKFNQYLLLYYRYGRCCKNLNKGYHTFFYNVLLSVCHYGCLVSELTVSKQMRFQILTAVGMNMAVFWDSSLCSEVQSHWHFRDGCCPHHRHDDEDRQHGASIHKTVTF